MKKEAIERLKITLELQREIVGVQFLSTEKDFTESSFNCLDGRRTVCGMVNLAQEGECIKVKAENFGCSAGGKSLGILKTDSSEIEECVLEASGLHKNIAIVKKITKESCEHEPCFGAVFAPLSSMKKADIVILIVNARQAMRIMQGYAYHYGFPKNITMIGNQAVCMELIARPFANKDINVSFLCRGTRSNLHALDEELGVAIPIEQLENVIEGIVETLSVVENERKKLEMTQIPNISKILGREIELNVSYMQRMKKKEKEFANTNLL